jgi:hypothetical protein
MEKGLAKVSASHPQKKKIKQSCQVSSTQKNLGNSLKQDLFRLCFGLFRETKNKKFWFVSFCCAVSNLFGNCFGQLPRLH